MELKKYLILLCLYDEIMKTRQLNPKKILEKYPINNRQMWSYIKNLKEYFNEFTELNLLYDPRLKIYYFE